MVLLNLHNCLTTYLVIGALLFAFGIYGMVTRRTIIGMLISSELLLAAAEAAIAVSIMVAVYRNYKSVDMEDLVDLQG